MRCGRLSECLLRLGILPERFHLLNVGLLKRFAALCQCSLDMCEPAAELSAQIDSILNTFSSMGAVVLSAVVQGSRVRTTLDVTDPKPGIISELILHLARLGRVRVITPADREEE